MTQCSPTTPHTNAALQANGISDEEFRQTELNAEALEQVYHRHCAGVADLEFAASYIAQRLQRLPMVHSLKTRVKDPSHLISKIIRKKLERPEEEIDLEKYDERITDLIGLRALHLFKDDWHDIHHFVMKTWDLYESPIAYVREGDPKEIQARFKEEGCDVREHPFGYRSIHYVLKFSPDKKTALAELQVRTIFEEGWSEIDHRVRYPRHSEDPFLAEFLAIFNRLAGSSDEMGTFLRRLCQFLADSERQLGERDHLLKEKDADLQKVIANLNIAQDEKKKLREHIRATQTTSELLTLKSAPFGQRIINRPRKPRCVRDTIARIRVYQYEDVRSMSQRVRPLPSGYDTCWSTLPIVPPESIRQLRSAARIELR